MRSAPRKHKNQNSQSEAPRLPDGAHGLPGLLKLDEVGGPGSQQLTPDENQALFMRVYEGPCCCCLFLVFLFLFSEFLSFYSIIDLGVFTSTEPFYEAQALDSSTWMVFPLGVVFGAPPS